MATQITKLTAEQSARMGEWVAKWLAVGLSTVPADFDAAEQAMRNLYAITKNAQPPVCATREALPYLRNHALS